MMDFRTPTRNQPGGEIRKLCRRRKMAPKNKMDFSILLLESSLVVYVRESTIK